MLEKEILERWIIFQNHRHSVKKIKFKVTFLHALYFLDRSQSVFSRYSPGDEAKRFC